jgi:AraC family transcriptional regulator
MYRGDLSTLGSETREWAGGSLGAVALQLVEAARSAWKGDPESTRARTSQALTLLAKELGSVGSSGWASPGAPQSGNRPRGAIRGGLAPFQARRLVAHIDAHLAERITLYQLARMAGLSTGHFSRAFKQTFGLPAHTYLTRRRIEFAQNVMLSSQLPLSDVALTCGLSDQAHFTRVFRKMVGETPSAWRRASRDALENAPAVPARGPTMGSL